MRWLLGIGFVVAAALVIWAAKAKLSEYDQVNTGLAETSAITSLKSVHNAQTLYFSTNGKYAAALKDLGPAPGADLIPEKVAAGLQGGYRFGMTGDAKKFAITAQPERPGSRSFFLDETGVVRASAAGEAANASSPAVP